MIQEMIHELTQILQDSSPQSLDNAMNIVIMSNNVDWFIGASHVQNC